MLNRTELDVRFLNHAARVNYADRFGALRDTPTPARRPRRVVAALRRRLAQQAPERVRVKGSRMRRLRAPLCIAVVALALGLSSPALAHPHVVTNPDHTQEIANGQNHAPFSADGTTCGGDPAAYGVESAHHGPDSGTPGKADGCYQVDSMPPSSDDQNPAID
jgi:hypothetical protein